MLHTNSLQSKVERCELRCDKNRIASRIKLHDVSHFPSRHIAAHHTSRHITPHHATSHHPPRTTSSPHNPLWFWHKIFFSYYHKGDDPSITDLCQYPCARSALPHSYRTPSLTSQPRRPSPSTPHPSFSKPCPSFLSFPSLPLKPNFQVFLLL